MLTFLPVLILLSQPLRVNFSLYNNLFLGLSLNRERRHRRRMGQDRQLVREDGHERPQQSPSPDHR